MHSVLKWVLNRHFQGRKKKQTKQSLKSSDFGSLEFQNLLKFDFCFGFSNIQNLTEMASNFILEVVFCILHS